MYRNSPVPHTGVNKRVGPYFRHPSTFQLMKELETWPMFHRKRFVPTAWDDLYNSKVGIRSWKRTKKAKQWQ